MNKASSLDFFRGDKEIRKCRGILLSLKKVLCNNCHPTNVPVLLAYFMAVLHSTLFIIFLFFICV